MRHGFTVGLLGVSMVLLTAGGIASAQTAPGAPIVSYPSNSAFSPPVWELPNRPAPTGAPGNVVEHPRPALPLVAAQPNAVDPVVQSKPGAAITPGTKTGFPGLGENGAIPPDPNIAVGQSQIVQVVNSQFAVYDKATGTRISGPTNLSSLWTRLGGSCATQNAGDPVVQYDNLGQRWLITQLGSLSSPYSECIAISTSSDATGTYQLYSYSFGNSLNDYPKFGVWPTASNPAYLASYNMFQNGRRFTGAQLCAYDRTAMMNSQPSPAKVCFTVSNGGNLPSDLDGPTPPGDSEPGYFLSFNSLSSLRMYQLLPNFLNPNTSTLTQVQPDIAVASFTEACNGGTCIPQPMTNEKLDSLGDRLMYRLAYRNFSTASPASGNCFGTTSSSCETMVVNHSVAPGSNTGVRWYQLLATTPGNFGVFQQGTYAPDGNDRWMGSAAMDKNGNIALGYSAASASLFPSVAATYRCPTTAPGQMGAEFAIQPGNGSQTGYTRWGDYSALRIDPGDDATFWYTNEYYAATSRFVWSTVISSFTVGTCP